MAFHADLGAHKHNLTQGQTIVFDTLKQNFGNAYNSHTGIFTCPKSGLYFFTLSIIANGGVITETKLLVNETPVMYTFSAGESTLDSGTNSVIVPMKTGDDARVVFHHFDPNIYGGPWSTFTGFLIQET